VSDTTKVSAQIFGNPCPNIDWEGAKSECKKAAKYDGDFAAIDVLRTFNININLSTVPVPNDYTSLCPLDILNQSPFSVIRSSLDALLVDGAYWKSMLTNMGKLAL